MAVGRLFSFADVVTGHEACQHKADHSNQVNYSHWHSPPFIGFPFGFLSERRITVPPERANRLPSTTAPERIILLRCASFNIHILTFLHFICFSTNGTRKSVYRTSYRLQQARRALRQYTACRPFPSPSSSRCYRTRTRR